MSTPDGVDCVLAFRWGIRENGELGPTNEALIDFNLEHYGTTPVIASQELGDGYAKKCDARGIPVRLIEVDDQGPDKSLHEPTPAGTLLVVNVTTAWRTTSHWWQSLAPGAVEREDDRVRHDTREFVGQCKDLMRVLGWKKAGVVAMPVQLERIRLVGEQADLDLSVPEELAEGILEIPYDEESKEPWTRNHALSKAYEITTSQMYRATGPSAVREVADESPSSGIEMN